MIYYLITIKEGDLIRYKVLKGKTYKELENQLKDYPKDSLIEWEEITSKQTKTFINCIYNYAALSTNC